MWGEFERGKISVIHSSNRILLTCMYIGVFTLLVACSPTTIQKQFQKDAQDTLNYQNELVEEAALPSSSLAISKLSLISEKGVEIEFDPQLFEEKWELIYPKLQEDQLESGGKLLYTAIGWNKESQPVVFQMYSSGLKIGSNFFSGEAYQSFVQWVSEYIGLHYFEALTMERMTLQALDIGMKAQISDEKAAFLYEHITDAVLQKGEVRITSPLYPYYQLDVEYGGKDYVSIDLISPTLIALEDGHDRWYFQLSQSLFAELTEVIPLQDYSIQHIKHLYQAEGLVLEYEGRKVDLQQAVDDQLKIKAYIHDIARTLARSQSRGMEELVEPQEKHAVLTFIFANQETQTVQLYEDYFIYHHRLYDLAKVDEKIAEVVSVLPVK